MMLQSPQPLLQRNHVSADHPYAIVREQEADRDGRIADVLTVFLTASECPIGCHMCDLWKNTLTSPTPKGAIPRQIQVAIDSPQWQTPPPAKAVDTDLAPVTSFVPIQQSAKPLRWIKLYNNGNFFDVRSIPPTDYPVIAQACEDFERVIVENHPRFGRERVRQFRELIDARLEVAVGLETVQPRWLDRLGKQMTRDDFDQYARWLRLQQVDLRVFLMVGVPEASVQESLAWSSLSIRHAARMGARHISVIPARAGNGWGLTHPRLPAITASHLLDLQEDAIERLQGQSVVTVDLWDLSPNGNERDAAAHAQIDRLNRSQHS